MKTLDENDPRLTAYALDELDAAERETVEKFLAENPAARGAVEEIRETIAMLREEFEGESALVLGASQRAAVLENAPETDGAESKIVRPKGFSRVSRFLGVAAVAACLCAVSVVGLRHYMEQASRPPVASEASRAIVAEEDRRDRSGAKVERGDEEKADARLFKQAAPGRAMEPESLALAPEESAEAPVVPAPDPTRSRAAGSLESAPGELARDERERLKTITRSKPAAPEADAAGLPSPAVTAPADPAAVARKKETLRPMAAAPGTIVTDGALMVPAPSLSDQGFQDGFGTEDTGDGFGGAPNRESELARNNQPEARRRIALPPAPAAPADPSGADAAAVESKLSTVSRRDARTQNRTVGGEQYAPLVDNPFVSTWDNNVSTFSIDVDNASYSNIRRMVTRNHQLPPKDAVRVEEMINYFDYDYPQPADGRPFSVNLEVASCPWEKDARLVRIGLKGLEMHPDKRPPSNLVFLIDVSGSMSSDDKLPLLQSAMMALVDALNEDDSIAIVVYAGNSGLVLDSTSGDLKGKIKDALAKLQSGGSTNGGQGIELAYATAKQHFIEGGVNRVVLATDGDFNVGVTNHESLVGMVEEKAKNDRVFLTVLGFGQGNLNDHMLEQIADKGNGNYFYIDNAKEGQRVLVDRLSATLVTIAKDVKIQVDFNPAKVARYRLIGYANRMMENREFLDDSKDAGEIGAGHTVTALYQILPAGTETALAEEEEAKAKVEENPSKYLKSDTATEVDKAQAQELIPSDELLTVGLRYKQPEADESEGFEVGLVDPGTRWEEAGGDYRFAASVAGYGMLLRDSEYKGQLNYDLVLELADEGKGSDPHGLRAEFIDLVKASKELAGEKE